MTGSACALTLCSRLLTGREGASGEGSDCRRLLSVFLLSNPGHRWAEGRQRDEVECAVGTWGEGEERRKVQASFGFWVVEKERLNPVHGQSVRDSPQGMVLGRNANSLSSGLTSRVCVSLLFLGYIDCTEDRTHMWRSYNLQSQLSPSTAWPPRVEVRSPGLMAGTITHHLTSAVLLLWIQ